MNLRITRISNIHAGISERSGQPHYLGWVYAFTASVLLAACGSDEGSGSHATNGGAGGNTAVSVGGTNGDSVAGASAGGSRAGSVGNSDAGEDSGGSNDGPATGNDSLFATSTVVFNPDGDSTYLSLLTNLDSPTIDLGRAREFTGWTSVWSHEHKLFLSAGEEPTMTRYAVADDLDFEVEGRISFLNQGAVFADSLFVAPNKAYVFADDAVVWDPQRMEITGSFALPKVADREAGLVYSGLRTGRSAVVRGNRAYVATNWANWNEYSVSEDSVIVVIDTDKDEVKALLPVACPYLDVATLADDGTVYFSNWVYSLGATVLHGKRKACAARILPGEDTIDGWSLTFADVTGGREAAALRALGDGKALISVFYHEEADTSLDDAALADSANWRFWELDLATRRASPVNDIAPFAGGFSMSRVDGRSFALVPSADYESTTVYELLRNGGAVHRWETPGWSTELVKLR